MSNPFSTQPRDLKLEISEYVDLPTIRSIDKEFDFINRRRYCQHAKVISQQEIMKLNTLRCTYYFSHNGQILDAHLRIGNEDIFYKATSYLD